MARYNKVSFKERDLRRAMRAIRAEGAEAQSIEVDKSGTIRIFTRNSSPQESADESSIPALAIDAA